MESRRRPKMTVLAAGAAASLALAACGASSPTSNKGQSPSSPKSGSSGVQTITFWNSGPSAGTGGSNAGVPEIISKFNKQYSGRYHVDYKSIPYANESALVNSALGAHKQPDLIEESLTFGSGYAAEGVVEPIDPILKMAGINPATDFPKSLWSPSSVNGVHYLAPNNAIPTLLFYNKALFKKAGLNPNNPPTTGAELVSDAQAITKLGNGIWGYVEEPTGGGMNYSIQSVMDQEGAPLANAKTHKITFANSGGVKAVQYFRDLIFKYHVSPANASSEEANALFQKGKDGMEITGAYDYPVYQPVLKANLGVALIPKIGNNRENFLGQNYWWVFKTPSMTKSLEQGIADLMKLYYDNSTYLAQQGLFPTWLPAWHSKKFTSVATYGLQAKAVKDGVAHPPIPTVAELNHKYFFPDLEEALLGKVSTPSAVSKAGKDMQAALDQQSS